LRAGEGAPGPGCRISLIWAAPVEHRLDDQPLEVVLLLCPAGEETETSTSCHISEERGEGEEVSGTDDSPERHCRCRIPETKRLSRALLAGLLITRSTLPSRKMNPLSNTWRSSESGGRRTTREQDVAQVINELSPLSFAQKTEGLVGLNGGICCDMMAWTLCACVASRFLMPFVRTASLTNLLLHVILIPSIFSFIAHTLSLHFTKPSREYNTKFYFH